MHVYEGEVFDDAKPVRDAERNRPASVDPSGYSREAAEKKSASCRHCSGHGMATVFDPEYDGSPIITSMGPDGRERRRPGRTMAYCVCLMGRWTRQNHRENAPDVYARMLDFEDILGKSSMWLDCDPTLSDAHVNARALAAIQRIRERVQRRPEPPPAYPKQP